MENPPPQPACYCPACGEVVTAGTSVERLLQCPRCGEQFFIADEITDPQEHEARATDDAPPNHESELSELRIHHARHVRQSAYRNRKWPIIGAAACLMAAAKLIQIGVVGFRTGMRAAPIVDMLVAIAALILFAHFVRRAITLTREIRASRLKDPITPPDFSTLSDGSQRYRNLEKMAGREE